MARRKQLQESMLVKQGKRRTEHGLGVCLELTGDEVARAIVAGLGVLGVHISGSGTLTVNGATCAFGCVNIDQPGFVIANGSKISSPE